MRNRLKSAAKILNNGERGMVFPIVLIALLLMGLLIPPLMGLIGTSLVTGQMYENSSYELYAADAGVMDAVWVLQSAEIPGERRIDPAKAAILFGADGTGIYSYTLLEEINGKTVSYQIVRDGAIGFIITSTATGADGSTTTIETRVEYLPPPPPIMVAAGALNGDLKINAEVGSADQWISIYANGDISMIGSGQIYGDAYYTSGYTVSPPTSGIFHGDTIETVKLELVDGVIPENPKDLGDGYISGSLNIVESRTLGPVYIDGDLIISSNVQVELTGTVWVKGKIQINDDAIVYGTYDSGDRPLGMTDDDFSYLYSKYELDDPYFMITDYTGNGSAISVNGNTPEPSVSGHDYKVEALLYAPDGYIYVGGNASIKGSVVGREVTIIGASELNFPLPFQPVDPGPNPMDYYYWKIT